MKPAARVCFVIILLAASVGLLEAQFHLISRAFGRRPLGQREIAACFLGRYLAHEYAGRTALILSNPFCAKSGQPGEIYEFEKAGVRGLQRGLGSAVKIEQIVFPELKPEALAKPRSVFIDPRTTTPLSYLVDDHAVDKLVSKYPQAELLVSLIGLPALVRQTDTWKPDNQRKFALLLPDLRMVGNQAAVLDAIRSRKLAALVVNKPGAPPEDQPLGKDEKMEFEQRFLLITPETVDKYLQIYPRLFQ